MQQEENKTVDIDTSGPDTEVELEETQSTETPEVEASTNETEET